MHAESQAALQQTPSTQSPLAHSLASVHSTPFAGLHSPAASHAWPSSQPRPSVPAAASTQAPSASHSWHFAQCASFVHSVKQALAASSQANSSHSFSSPGAHSTLSTVAGAAARLDALGARRLAALGLGLRGAALAVVARRLERGGAGVAVRVAGGVAADVVGAEAARAVAGRGARLGVVALRARRSRRSRRRSLRCSSCRQNIRRRDPSPRDARAIDGGDELATHAEGRERASAERHREKVLFLPHSSPLRR